MSKFKFNLEGLLKLREFKEKQLKVELGNILKEIQKTKDRIAKFGHHIEEAYQAQESTLTSGDEQGKTRGDMIRFFPYFIEGKKAAINEEESKLEMLEEQYKKKVKEMTIARGETKVIDKLKEKKKDEFIKEKRKKDFEAIEEMRILRLGSAVSAGEER